jgi:rhomboid protease GluP
MGFEWFPIVSGLSTLLLLLQPRQVTGWQRVSLGILGLLAVGYLVPAGADCLTYGSWLWVLLIFLPLQGFAWIERLVQQEKFPQAAALMDWLRYLHPLDGWWEYPQLLRGLALAQSGQMAQAQKIFNQHQASQTAIGRMAHLLLQRMNGHWSDYIAWVEAEPATAPVWQDPSVQLMYLRSLGEVGRLDELLEYLQRFSRTLKQAGPNSLNLGRLYAFAFGGQPESLAWLFQYHLRRIHPDTQQYWLATAYGAAGMLPAAQKMLQDLSQTAAVGMQGPIDDRLQRPIKLANQHLSQSSQDYLTRLKAAILQEQDEPIVARPNIRKIPVSWALIVVNVAIGLFFMIAYVLFAAVLMNANYFTDRTLAQLEWLGVHMLALYDLGVLYPAKVLQGEWWRLLTAAFLHAGWFHLLSNMLGLYILGGIVEPLLGKWRYLIGYLITGIGSMALVTLLSAANVIRENAVVGASGAIMGLLGMMGAIFLMRWRQRREAMAAQRLKSVIAIAGFQTFMDSITPQVSMAGHLTGLGLGFCVALLLLQTMPRPSRS